MKCKKIVFSTLLMVGMIQNLNANEYKSDKEFSFKEAIEIIVSRITQIEEVLTKRNKIELDKELVKKATEDK